MRYSLTLLLIIALLTASQGCTKTGSDNYATLQKELTEFIAGKDAKIGIALIIDSTDTVSVNGNRAFPMLSVYKLPIALALAEHYRAQGLAFDNPVEIFKEDLHPDTYSPMTEKLLASSRMITGGLSMSTGELLAYMLQQSDNNASDIILRNVGGARYVADYLADTGIKDINVVNSESEMHDDTSLCYDNSATPIAMASLLDYFDCNCNDSLSVEIKSIMETCSTGTARLAKPLAQANAVIGHKTGTGFTLPDGRLMAINDAGYVHLPDGHRYSIAVFIEDSGYDMATTESIIADISGIVFSCIAKESPNIPRSGK